MFDICVKKRQGSFLIDAAFSSNDSGIIALFGKSGAGKTSIINMVAGLVMPDNGKIVVAGKCLFDSEKKINLSPEKRSLGYIFQEGRLFPHLSVKSNLVYGMRLTPSSKRYVRFDQVVELLGIGQLLNRRPASLSGGEKQRVAIGRALLTSPSLLLMDEPLASLDDERKAEILPFIKRLSGEFTIPILYVSHSPEEIMSIADTVVTIDKGRIAGVKNISELIHLHQAGFNPVSDPSNALPDSLMTGLDHRFSH